MLHKEHHGPDYLYRTGVGIMLLNEDKKIFTAQRISNTVNSSWQMPQGGVDRGEHEDEAVFRELYEETGIKNAQILKKSDDYHYYNLPYVLQKKFWGGKYMGQRQRWYLMKFEGHEQEIDLNVFDEPEFSNYQWSTNDFLVNNVVQFKKKIYENLVHEFNKYLAI